MMSNSGIQRGDIWLVDFEPTTGEEIQKIRPAAIVSMDATFRNQLRIVVPITTWQTRLASDFWMIRIPPSATNRLNKDSAANAFQVKSVSEVRFKHKLGNLTISELDDVVTAIAFCIGYNPQA